MGLNMTLGRTTRTTSWKRENDPEHVACDIIVICACRFTQRAFSLLSSNPDRLFLRVYGGNYYYSYYPPPHTLSAPRPPGPRVYQGICPAPPPKHSGHKTATNKVNAPPNVQVCFCTRLAAAAGHQAGRRRYGLAHVTALPPAAVLHLSRLKKKTPTLLTLYASRPACHQATASAQVPVCFGNR